MQIEHGFRNRQSQSVAFCAARRIGLIIRLPQPRQRVRRNGIAGIRHREHAVREVHRDAAVCRRMLHGVLKQSVQCPREQCPVRIDLVFALCCKFGVDGGIGRQSRLQALLRQFCQRERGSPQSLCAGLQPRQFKHVPHTAVHPLRLLLNDTQIVRLLFRCKVVTEQLGGGAEHGKRRFQLVRERGCRFAAYPLYALLFAPDAQLRTGQHCRAE